jgi:predicted RNA binding protein YcfA (HicA-like mRNA interferase family)
MSELPSVTGRQAISVFEQHGFEVVRVCGSHHIMKKTGHRFVLSVPLHGNRAIKRGTLRGLISAAGITIEEFINTL